MSRMGTLYINDDTPLHRLDGSVKFLLLMTWTIITFLFLDLRISVFMIIFGIILLYISKISLKVIKPLFWLMIIFNVINSIFIIFVTSSYGTVLTGTNTQLLSIGSIKINLEIIFYVITLSLKYANLLPITLIFIFTTHPSRFASSLNKIGIPYKIAYAVNISFRYIPDIQQEFKNILHSQQARGISFKKGEATLKQRIKNIISIAVPLITSSLQRIEIVTNAMELRGFGKHKKRTWYKGTKFQKGDYLVTITCAIFIIIAVFLKIKIFTTFWYPF